MIQAHTSKTTSVRSGKFHMSITETEGKIQIDLSGPPTGEFIHAVTFASMGSRSSPKNEIRLESLAEAQELIELLRFAFKAEAEK